MRVLLIRPWLNENITSIRNFFFGEPLGIACVSTILKEQNHKVLLVDFMADEKNSLEYYLQNFKPDIVGITSQCSDVVNVSKIAKMTKAFNKKIFVMVGGVHASCFSNCFFKKDIDFVFKSTTRENIYKLFDCIEKRDFSEIIEGVYSRNHKFINNGKFCLNEYVIPDREITKRYRKNYKYVGFQPCAVMQTAYGCRNRCNFCVRWRLEGENLIELPISEVFRQISEIEEKNIMICDNDFLINEKRLIEFCDLLEKHNIKKKYICYGSTNSILEKPELFKRLAKNGLSAVIVGFEAFDDIRLQEYNKPANTDENLEAVKILHKNKIACYGSFIVHPDWDKDDFKKMLKYLNLLNPELMSFSPLIPHPLTDLYEQYKDRLIYSIEEYEKWNFGDVVIMPSKMSLHDYYIEVFKIALKVNLNKTTLLYTLKTFDFKNIIRMIFGFRRIFRVYLKNIFKSL